MSRHRAIGLAPTAEERFFRNQHQLTIQDARACCAIIRGSTAPTYREIMRYVISIHRVGHRLSFRDLRHAHAALDRIPYVELQRGTDVYDFAVACNTLARRALDFVVSTHPLPVRLRTLKDQVLAHLLSAHRRNVTVESDPSNEGFVIVKLTLLDGYHGLHASVAYLREHHPGLLP